MEARKLARRSETKMTISIRDAQQRFRPSNCYLDTATYGLANSDTVDALTEGIHQWYGGAATLQGYDTAVDTSRGAFGRILGAGEGEVAIGSQTAPFVAVVAGSVPPGGEVLLADDEFTSVVWPVLIRKLVNQCTVKFVPLKELAEQAGPSTRLVCVSAVQSRDGALADLDSIADAAAANGARTLIDVTQAAGWLPISASRFDFVVCSAYKWLLAPRGAAFMAIKAEVMDETPPMLASWYAGEVVKDSLYGDPLRLANDARRYDVSPAWLTWIGAVPALDLIEQVGVNAIHRHNVGLASQFQQRLGIQPNGSAIVRVSNIPNANTRLENAGVKASIRDGSARVAFHLYNTDEDVEDAVTALTR